MASLLQKDLGNSEKPGRSASQQALIRILVFPWVGITNSDFGQKVVLVDFYIDGDQGVVIHTVMERHVFVT